MLKKCVDSRPTRPPKVDRQGQYRSNKKNVSKGAVFKMKALIGGAFVAEMGGVLEDAWIEAQAAWRKQSVWIAQVGQEVLPEARLGLGRHQRDQQERIAEHVNGMREAEAIGVQVGLSRRGGHEGAHGVVQQEQAREFLQHPQRGATA